MLLARYVKSDGGEEPALQMQSRNVLPYDWDESLFSYDPATTVMSYNDPAAVTEASPVHSRSLTALYFPNALSGRAARHRKVP